MCEERGGAHLARVAHGHLDTEESLPRRRRRGGELVRRLELEQRHSLGGEALLQREQHRLELVDLGAHLTMRRCGQI